jgi:hypothetical protein
MSRKERSFRKNAAIIIGSLAVCPTLVLGLVMPCLFILLPVIALMVYGIVLASYQLAV